MWIRILLYLKWFSSGSAADGVYDWRFPRGGEDASPTVAAGERTWKQREIDVPGEWRGLG